ncbi:MAG: hypothetical protein LUG95_05175 [Clostridiales bacterium]|nr:hypothetical protein [Clostridiales bacterium]
MRAKNGKIGNLFHIVMENDGEDCNNIEIVFNSVHFAEIGFYTYRGDTRAVDSFSPTTYSQTIICLNLTMIWKTHF